MDAAAFCEGEVLVVTRPRPEKGTDLVEDATAACGGGEGSQPARRAIPLFNAPMILLQRVVEVAIRPVGHPLPKDVADGAWVGGMAIGGDALRCHPGHRLCRAEEGLSRRKVARVAQLCVH
jgi:hypothetical protein